MTGYGSGAFRSFSWVPVTRVFRGLHWYPSSLLLRWDGQMELTLTFAMALDWGLVIKVNGNLSIKEDLSRLEEMGWEQWGQKRGLQRWTDRLGSSSVEEDMDNTLLNVLITSDCINYPKDWSFFTEENQIIVLKLEEDRSNKLRALIPPHPTSASFFFSYLNPYSQMVISFCDYFM